MAYGQRHHRRHNPSRTSEAIVLLSAVGGAIGTQALDVAVVNPLARRFGLPATGIIGELGDAATTFLTAWGGGKVLELAGVPERYVDPAVFVGEVVAVSKGAAAFVPGFTFAPTPPIFISNLLPGHKAAPKQLAAAGATGAGVTALGTAGTVSRPSEPQSDDLDGGF
jgi:hypothetical protein